MSDSRLARRSANGAEAAALQAAVARLFGVDRDGLAQILEGFPLLSDEERRSAVAAMAERDST